jgi:D-alanyl-D-alanine carboxypeptidase/D-alanyl-D-alanine-endopeptidase (penicillin-binding protein 4)
VRLTAPAVTTPLLVEHVSQPLPALINRLLKPSDNLMAECLLKTLGAANAVPGTAAGGVAACRRWQIGVGLYGAELSQVDGSGLSRQDLVSPHNLVRLLRAMHDRPDFQTFYDALPIAGVDGTLRRRMLRSLAAGNCHAKTGSLTHVSALSGYVATRDGEMLVFSIMMNNQLAPGSACTSVQDAIVELLAGYARPHASNEAEQ